MVDYNPFMDEIIEGDAHPIYKQMRAESPVHYIEEFDAWFLFKFDDIWRSGANFKQLSAAEGTTPGHLLLQDTPPSLSFTQMDPPKHSHYRAAVSSHFKPGAVKKLIEEKIRAHAKEFVDGFIERGEADLVADYALRISVRSASLVGGLPIEEADTMSGWVNELFERRKGHRGMTEEGQQAGKDMFFFFLDYVKKMRKNQDKATGLLHTMLVGEIEGKQMSDFEVASTLSLALVGGTDTFPKALGSTFIRLCQNPDQRAEVAADLSLCQDAFLEALRIDTPTQMLGRTVVADIEYRGHTAKPGQKVMFVFPSGDRDEDEFERPDVYDIKRRPQRIVAFGQGVHMCMGKHVAILEAKIALEEILKRIPNYEVIEDQCERTKTEFVQGPVRLPIRFDPA